MATKTVVKASTECKHRWRIEEANGPESLGDCKLCGSTKTFQNWLPRGDFVTNEEHRMGAATW